LIFFSQRRCHLVQEEDAAAAEEDSDRGTVERLRFAVELPTSRPALIYREAMTEVIVRKKIVTAIATTTEMTTKEATVTQHLPLQPRPQLLSPPPLPVRSCARPLDSVLARVR